MNARPDPLPACRIAEGQSSVYERLRDLPRLLRLWPEEVRRLGPGDQAWLVERLGQVLRAERQRGITRHWSYDLSRHAALLRAWRGEKAMLDVVLKPAPMRMAQIERREDRVAVAPRARLSLQSVPDGISIEFGEGARLPPAPALAQAHLLGQG